MIRTFEYRSLISRVSHTRVTRLYGSPFINKAELLISPIIIDDIIILIFTIIRFLIYSSIFFKHSVKQLTKILFLYVNAALIEFKLHNFNLFKLFTIYYFIRPVKIYMNLNLTIII